MLVWSIVTLLVYYFCPVSLAAGNGIGAHSWQTWGPYRPNLYFGVRPQIPDTFLMGLMWASGENRNKMLKTLRDTCEQDDAVQRYGWTAYDTRVGGSQVMHDKELHIGLETDFIKTRIGDNWAVRVAGTPRPDAPHNVKTTVIFHTAVENSNDAKTIICGSKDLEGTDREITCRGEVDALGSFEFSVVGDAQNNVIHATSVNSIEVPEDKIWQAKSVFKDRVTAHIGSGDDNVMIAHEPGIGNMHFIQLTFEGPFALTFMYRASGAVVLRPNVVEKGLETFRSAFPTGVDKVFPRAAPFEDEKYANFSQALLSNLLGGLGFFHGDSKVDYSRAPEYEETDVKFWEKASAAMARAPITTTTPTSLLSFTPSRPFFPRGFLWDEGFHLLPVIEWDLDLAVSVLESWLDQMDEDGWIAREQILGPEARSKVPEQFQVQYPHHTNPPTLSLLFPVLISKLAGTFTYTGHPSDYVPLPAQAKVMMKRLYHPLARHYKWFRHTQVGDFSGKYPRPEGAVVGEGYRWRGRTPMHNLASGLDDYPRANPPHPGELHVDALAWVGASAHALHQVAVYLEEEEDAAIYEKHLKEVKHNLDVLHWDAMEQAYCDATIEGDKYKRVCHHGYISLFPLLLGLIDADHPNLPAVLSLLSDPRKLWSPHGLRSLSAANEFYGKDEDYWRGAVWMNLNVLAVLRLKDIGLQGYTSGKEPTPTQSEALSLAAQLRELVVETVYKSWEETGFFWEQYKDKTGKGSHSRAFTGWTACVTLLLGVDLAKYTGNSPESAGASSFWMSNWAFMLAFGLLIVAMASGKRVVARVIRTMRQWRTWRQDWTNGRRYEQVIDLSEREPQY
ncbi:glycoside hydrolase family 63 protein [Hypoxylon trugodes]|uniref:glycoside hydrolase family 63 protein n=1 Tax=Hypoxylon trugodes TaxID=326681 RepID=UPI002197D0B8|nr:glycoside hydrolase family 63 protein [Hypoxylon trugodes]KAI1384902.1 glycoside hydrolase family 63 protein [Hypoxylon trugodes]